MFAKSPFKPLRDHMDKVVESVAPLKDFLMHCIRETIQKSKKFSKYHLLKKKQI